MQACFIGRLYGEASLYISVKQLEDLSMGKMLNDRRTVIILFLFAPTALLLIFGYFPAVKLFQYSLTNWDGFSPDFKYIGFSNFQRVFRDKDIMASFAHILAYVAMALVQNALALYLAIILNGKVFGRNFFRSSIFMPYILNGVAVAFMFNFMYNYNSGPINEVLRGIGLEPIEWLSANGYSSNFSLAFISMWRFLGLTMVIYLGSLQSLPNDAFEAIEMDGGNFYHKIRYIILPGISMIIQLTLFISINASVQSFFESWVITPGGGPNGATSTFVTKTIDIAFKYNDFGEASAMGVILLFMIAIIFGIQNLVLKGKDTSAE